MSVKEIPPHALSEHEKERKLMELDAKYCEYKSKFYATIAECKRALINRDWDTIQELEGKEINLGDTGVIKLFPKMVPPLFRTGNLVEHEDFGIGVITGFNSISGEPHVFFYSIQKTVSLEYSCLKSI